jgi:ribonuclease inhibitor
VIEPHRRTLELDVSAAASVDALHAQLASCLGFPEYYGRNWDAFWDCVCDPGQSQMPDVLRVVGWECLAERLPRDAKLLRDCLDELPRARPECRVEWGP